MQTIVVEHQHVFDRVERERELRVRAAVVGDVARVVDVHEVRDFFLDEGAARIHFIEIDAVELLQARRWYDVAVRADDGDFLRQAAGHLENGNDSASDPAFGT